MTLDLFTHEIPCFLRKGRQYKGRQNEMKGVEESIVPTLSDT